MAPTYSSPTTRCATVGRVTRAHGRVHADATLGREADRIGRDRTGECGHSLRRAEVSRNAPIRHCERRRAARSRRRLPDAAAPRRLVLDPQVDHPPTARSPHVRGRAFPDTASRFTKCAKNGTSRTPRGRSATRSRTRESNIAAPVAGCARNGVLRTRSGRRNAHGRTRVSGRQCVHRRSRDRAVIAVACRLQVELDLSADVTVRVEYEEPRHNGVIEPQIAWCGHAFGCPGPESLGAGTAIEGTEAAFEVSLRYLGGRRLRVHRACSSPDGYRRLEDDEAHCGSHLDVARMTRLGPGDPDKLSTFSRIPDGGWPWTTIAVRRGEDEIAASVDDLSRQLGVVVRRLISGVRHHGFPSSFILHWRFDADGSPPADTSCTSRPRPPAQLIAVSWVTRCRACTANRPPAIKYPATTPNTAICCVIDRRLDGATELPRRLFGRLPTDVGDRRSADRMCCQGVVAGVSGRPVMGHSGEGRLS
jgi:hypothetical protein